MVIPKKRRVVVKLFFPLFIAIVVIISFTNALIASAASLPDLLRQAGLSKREAKSDKWVQAQDRNRKNTEQRSEMRPQQTEKRNQQQLLKDEVNVAPVNNTVVQKPAPPVLRANTVAAPQAAKVPSPPPDTSTESLLVSSEQAKKAVQPVHYHSAKISTDHRNELLRASVVVSGIAALIYAVSYVGAVWRLFYGESLPAARTAASQN